MAAPHVAGAAALYLSGAPLSEPDQVRDVLVKMATPGVDDAGLGSPNRMLYTGFIVTVTWPGPTL